MEFFLQKKYISVILCIFAIAPHAFQTSSYPTSGDLTTLTNHAVIYKNSRVLNFRALNQIASVNPNDCNTYTTCTSCATSAFPCDWCVDKHSCTHDTAENCRNNILITGSNRIGPSMRGGPSFCPRINVTNGSPEILVPFGTEKRIRVLTDNMVQQMVVQKQFSCRFNIEGKIVSVSTELVENTITCDAILFNYNSSAPNVKVPLAVVWDETKPLDNPDNIHITVFRCSVLADNCGMCLVMEEKYNCGWCQSSQTCTVREQCDNGMGVWLNRNQTCPNPEISNFEPKSGPWEGGTNVTINGFSLGKKFEDINSGVTVAGVQCQPYNHLYVQTRRIVCKLDSPGQNDFQTGPIIVRIAGYRAQSIEHYRFVDPKIKSISPSSGPKSGGTRVSIVGEHLNAGSSVKAFVDGIPCRILSKGINRLTCRTGTSNITMKASLVIKFDETERKYEPGFNYVEDPVIFDMNRLLRSTPAGGINITVKGQNFDIIQEPSMYVLYNGTSYRSSCRVANNETMYCSTPKMDVDFNFVDANALGGMSLRYGFILDTVNTSFGSQSDEKMFHIFPERVYNAIMRNVEEELVPGPDDSLLKNIIGVCCGVIVLIMIVYGAIVTRERKQYYRIKAQEQAADHQKALKLFLEGDQEMAKTIKIPAERSYYVPFSKVIPPEDITLTDAKQLGSGQFGTVVLAKYKNEPAAVKIIKHGSDKEQMKEFLKEIKIMAYIGEHANIVQMYGAEISKLASGVVLVVLELCPHGDLEDYLRKQRSNFNYVRVPYQVGTNEVCIPAQDDQGSTPLNFSNLVDWSRQIANGLAYLEEKQVVHGDLATRNALLFDNNVVKVSDFGFSRKTYGKQYTKANKQTPLPFQWAAPETLDQMTFSTQTDVWSYGVTVWEIFTLGNCPFPQQSWDLTFSTRLREGMRLEKPELATDEIYDSLMMHCWQIDPDNRPTFIQICELWDHLYGMKSQDAFKSSDVRYVIR